MAHKSLNARVAAAAGEALARQGFVTPVDVCLGLGWLRASNVDDWRHGRVDDLEYFLPVHGGRLTELLVCLHRWAGGHGLQGTEGEYISTTRSRHTLRFLSDGAATEEAAWRTRWVSSDLPEQRRERIAKAQDSPPDLVVIQPVRDWTSLRGSGRVGRSAAGRSLDEQAITLAVVASVRHEDTTYDSLLMAGISREEARDRIRPTVDRVLASWS